MENEKDKPNLLLNLACALAPPLGSFWGATKSIFPLSGLLWVSLIGSATAIVFLICGSSRKVRQAAWSLFAGFFTVFSLLFVGFILFAFSMLY